MVRTKNFAEVIRDRLVINPALAVDVESEALHAEVGMKVYQARTQARMTQKQLAELIGTRQSVISRIEDADYEGHSLALLQRIARALGKSLRVEFQSHVAPTRSKKPRVKPSMPKKPSKR